MLQKADFCQPFAFHHLPHWSTFSFPLPTLIFSGSKETARQASDTDTKIREGRAGYKH